MTHYQKLATMIFRIIGVILIIGSFIMWIPAFLLSLPATNPFFVLFTILPYSIIGIVLFSLSKLFAKWVCFDFNKFDE